MYAVQLSGYHLVDSNWLDYRRFQNTQHSHASGLNAEVREWLLDPTSLTQRLIKASGGQFEVRILNQSWQRPRQSEIKLLGINAREMAIVREVSLLCAGIPWVFARSVFPASSLTGHLRRLRKLNNCSLGTMLFQDKTMQRHPFQLARINGNSIQIPEHLREANLLWARRSRFELANKPIMVSEIFLNTFRP